MSEQGAVQEAIKASHERWPHDATSRTIEIARQAYHAALRDAEEVVRQYNRELAGTGKDALPLEIAKRIAALGGDDE